LFIGYTDTGDRAAVLYSLVVSCLRTAAARSEFT